MSGTANLKLQLLFQELWLSRIVGQEFQITAPNNRNERRKLVKLQVRAARQAANARDSEDFGVAATWEKLSEMLDTHTGYSKTPKGGLRLFRIHAGGELYWDQD